MKTNELQSLWKGNIDSYISDYSKEELKSILVNKARSHIRGFYSLEILSVVCGIFGFFLVVASIAHKSDALYVINNIILIVILAFSLTSSIWSYKKMKNCNADEPLKLWLKRRIFYIEVSQHFYIANCIILPVVLIMTNISTLVYLNSSTFSEMIVSSTFFISLFISLIVTIPIVYLGEKRRKKTGDNIIINLKEIYNQFDD
ncbi:hypothetical protein FACS1894179_11290 [Bacteroidia bacterium]|nr:hypothetical protein FACS1894179_11290 [Bacteroidia bacterium]